MKGTTLKMSPGVFNRTLSGSEALTICGCTRLFGRLDGEVWKTAFNFCFPVMWRDA